MPTISSGVTSGVTFASGTATTVLSAAEVESSLIENGALVVDSGASFVSNTLSGELQLLGGAVTSDTVIARGGVAYAIASAVTFDDTIQSGGTEVVAWRSHVEFAYVSGGYLAISAFGSTVDVVLIAGGTDRVSSGGYALHTFISSGGVENVLGDGLAAEPNVLAGGFVFVSGSTGSTGSTYGALVDGGAISIKSFGIASGSLIESGGYVFAQAGGVADGASVSNGGIEYAGSGGLVEEAEVWSGGAVKVEAGGSATEVTVVAGGLIVSNGGVASDDTAIGLELVLSGGTVSSESVFGGELLVSSGGMVADGLTMLVGSAVIFGVVSSGVVNFQSAIDDGNPSDLELYNLAGFSAQISGFYGPAREIDLGGFAYSHLSETVSWNQVGSSGMLTVTDGAQVASLSLIGFYETGDFELSTDYKGGTIIRAPSATDKPAMFAQTMAAFAIPTTGAGTADTFTGSGLLSAAPLIPTGAGSAGQ